MEAGWLAKGFEGACVEVMIVNANGSEEDRMPVKLINAFQIYFAALIEDRTG